MSYKDVLDIKVNPNLPEDLAITPKQKNIPRDYFDIVVDDLNSDSEYALQFQWVYNDGSVSNWSPSYLIDTEADPPKVPTGFTASSEFASILITWDGTYQGDDPEESFDGFKCINVYAGYENTYSNTTAKLAGVLYSDLIENTITLSVDGTYVRYSEPVYIFASAVNANGDESSKALVATVSGGATRASDVDLGPGAVTISKLKGDVLVFNNIKAGTIDATSFLRAGNATGARIELSSSTTNITSYPDPITGSPISLTYPVLPGLAVYDSANDVKFRADLAGYVAIGGYTPTDIGSISSTASSASSTASTANSRAQKFDTSGNINAGIIMNSSGSIYSSKTSYTDTTTGWYIGWYSSNPVINIGSSTNYIKWTGSALDIKGPLEVTGGGKIGQLFISASNPYIYPATALDDIRITNNDNTIGIQLRTNYTFVLWGSDVRLNQSNSSSRHGLRNITVQTSTTMPSTYQTQYDSINNPLLVKNYVDGDIVFVYE